MPAYKEKNGTWKAMFRVTTYDGKRKQVTKRGFKKKSEALKYEREELLRQSGSSDITLNSLYLDYIKDCEVRLKPTTVSGKKYLIETKILPILGDHQINKIDGKTIRRWQNWLLSQNPRNDPDKKLSQTYIKTINNQLSAMLNYAKAFYKLQENPMHVAGSIGKKKADEMSFWTLDEFNRFISYMRPEEPAPVFIFNLMFYTGIRPGEALALTVNDFNYTNSTLSINKSYSRLNKQDIISEPKTEKSKRVIALPAFLFDMLDEYIEKLYGYDPETRLFPYTKHYLRYKMLDGIKASGVKKIRVHDLRHSHASHLIEMNCSPLLIQERLGHEEIETTLQTYSHLYPNKQQDIARKLNDVVKMLSSKETKALKD